MLHNFQYTLSEIEESVQTTRAWVRSEPLFNRSEHSDFITFEPPRFAVENDELYVIQYFTVYSSIPRLDSRTMRAFHRYSVKRSVSTPGTVKNSMYREEDAGKIYIGE